MIATRFAALASFGLALVAFPAALVVFRLAADPICSPDDCYGESAWVPIGLFLSVFVAFLVAAARRLDDSSQVRGRRWLGITMLLGALPVGWLTYSRLADRLCPGDCGGDYMTMALGALLTAAVVVLCLVVIGIWVIATSPRSATHGLPPRASGVR